MTRLNSIIFIVCTLFIEIILIKSYFEHNNLVLYLSLFGFIFGLFAAKMVYNNKEID